MKWREAIQCFEQLSTGERFNLSMNHFFAKISKTDADRQDNMRYLINKLPAALSYDPDVLVMGDLNGFTMEESNLMLSRNKGYVDLLMKHDPTGYSHIYDQQVGYLDHAYCTPSLSKQVTKAVSYHLNADTDKKTYAYTAWDESMYRYSDHDPILVGMRLGDNIPDPEPHAVDNIQTTSPFTKQIINGTLYIISNGIRYTVTGVRVE
jgi:predicted extracellular nuclease